MKVEIKGLDQLMKDFEKVGSAQKVNAVVDKALEKVAVKIEAQARKNLTESVYSTPESWYIRSGELRGDGLSTEKIPKGWAVVDVMNYAAYVEFGTGTLGDPSVPHTTKQYWSYKGKDGKYHTSHGMKPRPFLLPAFNQYKDEIPAAIKVNLSQALKEEIRRG